MATTKKIKIYTEEEYKKTYAILYEYFTSYKSPLTLEEIANNFKNSIKAKNDFDTIGYDVCMNLLKKGYR